MVKLTKSPWPQYQPIISDQMIERLPAIEVVVSKNEDLRPWSPDRPESRRVKAGSTLGGTKSHSFRTDRHLGRSAKPLDHSEGRDAGPKEALALWPIPKGGTIRAANKSPKHSSCAACSGRPFWVIARHCAGAILPLVAVSQKMKILPQHFES